uniref:Rab-like protein 3 n=1 Tax=Oreochromis niloticus TaxID=8128 RepID=A0A669EN18_ORENI
MDRFRNESIRGTRLGWFRHVERGKSEMEPDELLRRPPKGAVERRRIDVEILILLQVQDYKEGTPEEKTFYIELWDVGGSVGSASSVKSTRAVFYNSVNGIILVHDLTNKKSSQNLYRWSLEALNKDSSPTGVIVSNGDYDREQFAENPVPLLLIGTKFDQIPENKRSEVLTRTAFLSEDFNAEEINLDCTNPRYLAAGTSNAVKLSRFFDKVIEKRYFTRDPSQMTGFTDRKRFNFKSLHYD